MTPSEQRVLAYFRAFWAKSQRAPMLTEVGKDLSLTRQRIHQLVRSLSVQGELLDAGRTSREMSYSYRAWKPKEAPVEPQDATGAGQ